LESLFYDLPNPHSRYPQSSESSESSEGYGGKIMITTGTFWIGFGLGALSMFVAIGVITIWLAERKAKQEAKKKDWQGWPG
jgi:hypothetical protein